MVMVMSPQATPTPPRILIVDDEPKVAKSIEATLRKHYNVFVVHSGIEAIKQARNHPPNLIILDVVMPGMGGLETCRQMRIDPTLTDVPILILTALGRTPDKIAGLEAGADDYLTKPFNVEELRLRIKAILRRTHPTKPKPNTENLRVGKLELDTNSYEVRTDKQEAKLTPMEFNLLYHLMVHPNEVFTSDRLLQEVWDYPSESGSPDLVRMHIKNLREKIEENPRKPKIILTIPRRGYTIASE